MKIHATAAFSAYLNDRINQYPYSHVRKTRHSMDCHWLLTKKVSPNGQHTNYYPVPAIQIPSKWLQEMIMAGVAIPLPDDLSEIVGNLVVWGQAYDSEWADRVMRMVEFTVEQGVEVTPKEMFWDAIEIKVVDLLLEKGLPPHQDPFGMLIVADVKHDFDAYYTHCQHFRCLLHKCVHSTNAYINFHENFSFQSFAIPNYEPTPEPAPSSL